jgi:prepilin-type N-terminal cleavage/methylation domain-containing protein
MIGRGKNEHAASRSAFTLFEVLVALALSTLLIAAAYAALELYWRLRTAGEDDVEQAQVARAVMQRIEADLLATIFQSTSAGDTTTTVTSSSSESSSSEEDTTLVEVIDPADTNDGGNSGLIGDSTSVVLSVSLPRSHATYAAVSEGPIGLPTSDLKSVTYLLAGSGMSALAQAVADRFPDSYTGSSAVVGLARIEGDRLLLSQADAVADVDTIASEAQMLAREIKLLQFEYTDGLQWYTSWDSKSYGSLPRAVRVTLSFQDLQTAASSAEVQPAKMYQLVVVLPPSDPISGGASSDYESEGDEDAE